VWRIRHETRPLLETPDIVGASTTQLLGMLRLPERNTRQHVRRRLQKMPADELLPAVDRWLAALPPIDPLFARLQLEALWMHQAHGSIELDRLERVLGMHEARARAGAARVLRYWLQLGDVTPVEALPLLERIVADTDMRVRLEGVVACGFLPSDLGAQVAAIAAERPMDDPMAKVLDETLVHLAEDDTSGSLLLKRVKLRRMTADDLLAQEIDETVATVMIARTDIPLERRMEVLDQLGADEATRVQRIEEELRASRSANATAALGQILHQLPAPAVSSVEQDLRETANLGAARGAAALSALLKHRLADAGDPDVDVTTLVGALAIIEAGDAPEDAVPRLQTAIESDTVDPTAAAIQIARHTSDREATFGWLAALVDTVDEATNDAWSEDHEKAMAALKAMHTTDREQWPSGFDAYQVDAAPETLMAKGRALYHDETVGCLRCHGADGAGLEGFPPLNRSPWLLGNPQRAAAIVMHGLYGEMTLHDGRTFSSVMEPLGASLADDQVAAVLTFARQSWGNFASPVSAEQVALARRAMPPGGSMWTVEEILASYPVSRDGLMGFEAPPRGLAAIPVVPIAIAINVVPLALIITIVMISTRKKTVSPGTPSR
jgi:mono/diheme cytochrome c family protein